MQSAASIQFVNDRAQNIGDAGGTRTNLTVNFKVYKRGPAHVAGIIYTPNFWVSRSEALAAFQYFEGDFEVWQAKASASGNNVKFEYVIFCDDFRGTTTVPRIYNTNNGETFRPLPGW